MASLWSSLTWKGLTKLKESTDVDEKASRRRSLSVKSRRSLSNLFNWPSSPTITTKSDCLESAHYPLYDPTNPEHRRPAESPVMIPSTLKEKRKPRLQSIADTLRFTATFFHARSTSDPLGSPPTSSRKSLRFSPCHSSINKKCPSPIIIPDSSPKLQLDLSQASLLEGTSYALTARPALETSFLESDASRTPCRPCRIVIPRPVLTDLPTSISDTNLPLENLFQDFDLISAPCCEPGENTPQTSTQNLQTTVEQALREEQECTDLEASNGGRPPDLPIRHLPSASYDAASELSDPGREVSGNLHTMLNDISNQRNEDVRTASFRSASSFAAFQASMNKCPFRKSRVEIGEPFVLFAAPQRRWSGETSSIDLESVESRSALEGPAESHASGAATTLKEPCTCHGHFSVPRISHLTKIKKRRGLHDGGDPKEILESFLTEQSMEDMTPSEGGTDAKLKEWTN